MNANDSALLIYQFEGSFYSLHQKLIKLRETILKQEERSYIKKVSKNFATFLDQRTNDQEKLTQADLTAWVAEYNHDIAQKDTDQISVWILPLNNDKYILNLYNFKKETAVKLVKMLKLNVYDKKSVTARDLRFGHCFRLYYPANISLEVLFRHLPSLTHRIDSLAEDITGNDWLVSFPERQWQTYFWQMLEFLKSDEGKLLVESKKVKLKKLKFITKIEQVPL